MQLAIFDVDGTLYRQGPVRRRMALALLADALARADLSVLRTIARYRRLKEALADAETPGFEPRLLALVAEATGRSPEAVAALVAEWIERRPLPLLARAQVAGVADLFARLRASGRRIAVLSDYPAHDKLAALGLSADLVASAGDADIGLMKPHPRGLQWLLDQAGVAPQAAVMIGDRAERDGLAARRAGMAALLRSPRPLPGWHCFADYRDPLFHLPA